MTQAGFDTFKWVQTFVEDPRLDYEQLRPVFCFLLLWNLFENKVCRTVSESASENKILAEIDNLRKPLVHVNEYKEYVSYICKKYVVDGDVKTLESALSLSERDPRTKELFRKVYNQGMDDEVSLAAMALLVVRRIRNNLFHGTKKIVALPDQVDLFTATNKILACVLEDLKESGVPMD